MDLIKSIKAYFNKMTSEISGMKVLILDKETTSLISLVYSQSQLLEKEIYLIDRIDNRKREKMKHLKCITFTRPTPQSIQYIADELRDPCFGEYYLYFSNSLNKSDIERLAESDAHEVVREVQEYFADYAAINSDLFSIGLESDTVIFRESPTSWDPAVLKRCCEGITSVLLSLKKKPVLRYEANSVMCRKLAAEVVYSIQNEGPLYDFRKTDAAPILLILDRRNDPFTPLLKSWTYQAMIHELLGIQNGRVDLSSVKDIRDEIKEIVLSTETDTFYATNMHLNLGDLGSNIKTYVDEFQQKHNSNKKIESITDMKRFVEDYPDFRKLSGMVTKHVALVSELSRKVAADHLLEVGELEQSLAVSNNHAADSKALQAILADISITNQTKTKLVLLYALRYEKSSTNIIRALTDILKISGASESQVGLCRDILTYVGADFRLESSAVDQLLATTKNVFKGLKGIENVYCQHTPRLVSILSDLVKGKLKDTQYPFHEGSGSAARERPVEVLVFMVGGATFAEASEVAKFNASVPGVRVVLGGTHIHNSDSFVRGVAESVKVWQNLDGKSELVAADVKRSVKTIP